MPAMLPTTPRRLPHPRPRRPLLGRLAEPPRLETAEILRVHGRRGELGSMVVLELRVGGFNPNRIAVRAERVRWKAWVPGVAALRLGGEIAEMTLGARAPFSVRAEKEIAAGSLPPDLLRRGGTLPMVLSLSMTARTPLGTVRFGRGSVEPMRSLSPRVALTTRELYLTGELGPELLQVRLGVPRTALMLQATHTGRALGALALPSLSLDRVAERVHRALDRLGETTRLACGLERRGATTPMAVRLGEPLGIPFQVLGGVLSVLHDGVRVGTAHINQPRPGDGELRAHLTAEPTGSLAQLRALVAAAGRGGSSIRLQGRLRVQPPPGGSIGPIREVRLNLAVGPDNVRFG
jgi:hypothetical protein